MKRCSACHGRIDSCFRIFQGYQEGEWYGVGYGFRHRQSPPFHQNAHLWVVTSGPRWQASGHWTSASAEHVQLSLHHSRPNEHEFEDRLKPGPTHTRWYSLVLLAKPDRGERAHTAGGRAGDAVWTSLCPKHLRTRATK